MDERARKDVWQCAIRTQHIPEHEIIRELRAARGSYEQSTRATNLSDVAILEQPRQDYAQQTSMRTDLLCPQGLPEANANFDFHPEHMSYGYVGQPGPSIQATSFAPTQQLCPADNGTDPPYNLAADDILPALPRDDLAVQLTPSSPQRSRKHSRHGKSDGIYLCPYCWKDFAASKDLIRHLRESCNQEQCWICPQCERSFRRADHFAAHHVKMEKCSGIVGTKKCAHVQAARHVKIQKQALGCGLCNVVSTSNGAFGAHLATHWSSNGGLPGKSKQDWDSRLKLRNLVEHRILHSGNESLQGRVEDLQAHLCNRDNASVDQQSSFLENGNNLEVTNRLYAILSRLENDQCGGPGGMPQQRMSFYGPSGFQDLDQGTGPSAHPDHGMPPMIHNFGATAAHQLQGLEISGPGRLAGSLTEDESQTLTQDYTSTSCCSWSGVADGSSLSRSIDPHLSQAYQGRSGGVDPLPSMGSRSVPQHRWDALGEPFFYQENDGRFDLPLNGMKRVNSPSGSEIDLSLTTLDIDCDDFVPDDEPRSRETTFNERDTDAPTNESAAPVYFGRTASARHRHVRQLRREVRRLSDQFSFHVPGTRHSSCEDESD